MLAAGREDLTMDTYIRKMPHSAYVKLASMLDSGNFWERFAVEIPMRLEMLGQDGAEPRYTHQQMATFALQGSKAGASPTRRVLQDWGTKNSRIRHLITVLVSAQLYQAADYLHNDLLRLGPVPRPGGGHSAADNNDNNGGSGSGGGISNGNTCLNMDNVCQECYAKPSAAAKDDCTLAARPCHPAEHHELTDMESVPGTERSDQMSCHSGAASVLCQDGSSLSQLQRQLSVSDEGAEEAWIGLQDIEIQTIGYSMLSTVTNNFNEKPLKDGGNLIGSGGFGMVYLGTFHNGFKIAVKCLKVADQMKEEDLLKQFETEVKVLSQYRHENILHLLGYSKDGPAPCLVYQYLPNGSLEDRLACLNGTPPLSAETRLKIIKGAASGIAYLNSEKHVHRDIKSANILLDSEFTAKVGDFATVCRAPSGSGQTTAVNVSVVIGTPAYLAREAYSFDISTKLDAYSFGVVLLEVVTGLPAQDNAREDAILQFHIMENVEEPSQIHDFVDPKAGEWGPGTIDTLYDIACKCLEDKKKNRPNVIDIKPELDRLTV